jgi:hypothetical protein
MSVYFLKRASLNSSLILDLRKEMWEQSHFSLLISNFQSWGLRGILTRLIGVCKNFLMEGLWKEATTEGNSPVHKRKLYG